jgi:hypothetical protein
MKKYNIPDKEKGKKRALSDEPMVHRKRRDASVKVLGTLREGGLVYIDRRMNRRYVF